jgi:WD40 repeat protein
VTDDGSPALGAIDPRTGLPAIFQISADGSEVLVSTRSGGVEFLATDTGQEARPSPGTSMIGIFPALASADWSRFGWTREDGRGQVWNLQSMTPAMEVPECASPRMMSPDGSLVVLGGGSLCASTDDLAPPLVTPPPDADLRSRVVEVESGRVVLDLGERDVFSGSFSPDGRYVALNVDAPEVYDMETGELVARIEDLAPVLSLWFDPGGRHLVIAMAEGRVAVLDFEAIVDGADFDDAAVFDEIVHPGATIRAALTDDGTLATAGNGDEWIRLWDISTGAMLVEFRHNRVDGPALGIPWVQMSPDASFLLYGDAGGIIRRFPLDSDDLIELAQSRVTRGLTPHECQQHFGSGDC